MWSLWSTILHHQHGQVAEMLSQTSRVQRLQAGPSPSSGLLLGKGGSLLAISVCSILLAAFYSFALSFLIAVLVKKIGKGWGAGNLDVLDLGERYSEEKGWIEKK